MREFERMRENLKDQTKSERRERIGNNLEKWKTIGENRKERKPGEGIRKNPKIEENLRESE